MYELIVHNLNGAPRGELYSSEASGIDNGSSAVKGTSLFVHLNAAGIDISAPKDTDDKIVIGYTKEGAAFQIIVDGFYGGDKEGTFTFVDQYVVPLMGDYSAALSLSEDAAAVTKSLIATIFALRAQHAPFAEFTMSLGVTYYKGKESFYAGFGIGDTGLVIKRTTGEIEQLVSHTEVDGFKDAFDSHSALNVALVIARNSVFNTRVHPGDELVGYTYIQPELEILAKTFDSPSLVKSETEKQIVKKMYVNATACTAATALFEHLLTLINNQQKLLVTRAKVSGKEVKFGDDCAIGRLFVPDEKGVKKLQLTAFAVALQSKLDGFITEESRKRGLWGLWGFFNGAYNNIEQARCVNNVLARYQHQSVVNSLIILAILSIDVFNEVTQSLRKEFNYASMPMLTNKLEQFILEEPSAGLFIEQVHETVAAIKEGIEHLDFKGLDRVLNNVLMKNELKYK